MLRRAAARPGMRLVAPGGVSTSVNSRLEGGKASVPSSSIHRVEFGDDSGEGADRIGGAVGIGDVALCPGHVDPHVDRTAPADLDGVAERGFAGGLADQDHVGTDAAFFEPVDDRDRAVARRAFLVAGDEQRERAVALRLGGGRGEGGDGAFHVVGAAAGEQAVLDVRLERVGGPAFAGGDDVEVAGEAEVRRARSANGDEVFNRGSPRVKRWTSKPKGTSAASSTSNTSPVAGVMLGQAMSRAARSTGSIWNVMMRA